FPLFIWIYQMNSGKFQALKSIELSINQGDFVMIMGKSGSGKTTLLNILGLLNSFDGGQFIFNGEDVTHFSDNQKSFLRNNYFGFIFQQFHLIDSLTISQNIEVPLLYKGGIKFKERHEKIDKYLELVGLRDKKKRMPSELSGGQQQRIAIARALINDPIVILADEPTGSLDTNTGEKVMKILQKLNAQNKTIIMVTHDPDMVKYANKVIYIQDGAVLRMSEHVYS
ncbi:ABC transporter ATP-binding protein, partial [Niallia circulans]|uniref:ABC transporter ATP-binding protein n=1 Tax=Niallia circulans TaxID=1397 RepID=UPI00300A5C5C